MISPTAASKASELADDGSRKPLIFRTNCRAAASISASEAGVTPRSVLMLLHMAPQKYPFLGQSGSRR